MLNGTSYCLLSGRDISQLTTCMDGKRQGLSFQRDGVYRATVIGFYKDDVKFEGRFLNEKIKGTIYEYQNGVPVKVVENDSYILVTLG